MTTRTRSSALESAVETEDVTPEFNPFLAEDASEEG